jgi:hypothetical protein
LVRLTRLLRSLVFLILEFAEVHDSANRRSGVRSDFDEVQSGFTGSY